MLLLSAGFRVILNIRQRSKLENQRVEVQGFSQAQCRGDFNKNKKRHRLGAPKYPICGRRLDVAFGTESTELYPNQSTAHRKGY